MLKPASEATRSRRSSRTPDGAEALPGRVEDSPSKGSKLESFDQRDPFRPLKDLVKEDGSPSSGGSSSGGSPSSGGGTGKSGSRPARPRAPRAAPAAPSSPAAPAAVARALRRRPERAGHAVVPLHGRTSLGSAASASKKIENVKSTHAAPDGENPVVVFMGVGRGREERRSSSSSTRRSPPQGEGKCRPRGADCRFVKLGLDEDSDEESSFISQGGGVQYTSSW